MGTQTDNDIVEAFTSSQLSESHAQELIPTGKGTDTLVATITFDAPMKLFTMQKVENLGQNHSLLIHDQQDREFISQNIVKMMEVQKRHTRFDSQIYKN